MYFTEIYLFTTNCYTDSCNCIELGIICFCVRLIRLSPQELCLPAPATTLDQQLVRCQSHRNHSPVIIIGMHRSGTTLLSRLLESLGLFLGRTKDENHEATFFQSTNDWLLRLAGGAWDNPAPITYLLENPQMRDKTTDYIRRYLLASPRAVSYLGWWNYLRYRRIGLASAPWGWKDPRNTFTLPLWLDIFPEAKVIHLHRSGVDVALSLRRRGRREYRLQRFYRSLPLLHWIRPKRGGFVDSLRCDRLDAGLALWREYVEQGGCHVAMLKERAFEVSFESLVREPALTLSALSKFCDLRVDPLAINRACEQIDTAVLPSGPDSQLYCPALRSS